jgi:predicted nucleic acid-binding protein
MRSYLLDAVILTDVLQDVPAAVSYVRTHGDEVVVSAASRASVLSGLDASTNHERARALFNAIPCLPITQAVADRAADLRRQYGFSLPAALEAAVALENSLTLVTRNTDDFDPNEHSFLTVPYPTPARRRERRS